MHAFAEALEQASQLAPAHPGLPQDQPAPSAPGAPGYATVAVPVNRITTPAQATPSDEQPVGALEPTRYRVASQPGDLTTPQSQARDETPLLGQSLEPRVPATPLAAVMPASLEPTLPVRPRTRRLSGSTAVMLVGLAMLVTAAGILGSLSLLTRFGVLGTRGGANAPTVVRGGTWTTDFSVDPFSFIPYTNLAPWAVMAQQALYLPLFYGDAHGGVHPGAATAIPTVQNGGISADATTWTFHLRPGLV